MKLTEAHFVVIDTETTGTDPNVDRVVDVALVEVSFTGIRELYSTLINPEIPIPATASAVHHIVDRHVTDAPKIDEVWEEVNNLIHDVVLVAHNAPFDRSMMPLDRPWICSYRLARHLWPDAPGHSNQVLRYWLGIECGDIPVHRALGDAFVTAHLFQRQMIHYLTFGDNDLDTFIEYINLPIEVRIMPFGKHKGIPMKDVPVDYLRWAQRNMTDLDSDLKWTIETILSKGANSNDNS